MYVANNEMRHLNPLQTAGVIPAIPVSVRSP
jgi:hypothetical protein